MLQARNITRVFNVAGSFAEGDDDEALREAEMTEMTMEAEDEEGCPMLENHLEACMKFLQASAESVVAHCVAGLNRSSPIVAA